MTAQALKALDQTVEEFNGDPKRLYLSGFSMGGYGT
jgi:predicted peptidase